VSATAAVTTLAAEANCFLKSSQPYLGHLSFEQILLLPRILLCGEAADKLDEYFQIAESTAAEYLIDTCTKTDDRVVRVTD
jgi:hypothetical protein